MMIRYFRYNYKEERDVVELHPYVNECIIFCLSVFEQYCGY